MFVPERKIVIPDNLELDSIALRRHAGGTHESREIRNQLIAACKDVYPQLLALVNSHADDKKIDETIAPAITKQTAQLVDYLDRQLHQISLDEITGNASFQFADKDRFLDSLEVFLVALSDFNQDFLDRHIAGIELKRCAVDLCIDVNSLLHANRALPSIEYPSDHGLLDTSPPLIQDLYRELVGISELGYDRSKNLITTERVYELHKPSIELLLSTTALHLSEGVDPVSTQFAREFWSSGHFFLISGETLTIGVPLTHSDKNRLNEYFGDFKRSVKTFHKLLSSAP